ncbi:MAG: cation:proton antiporter [Candidatus Hydrogenedentota bacterium]|nr:MAG: cation:proton antiporter [Candidatus Hydrogenedentota bacterium]
MEQILSSIFLHLALLIGVTYLLSILFERLKIPSLVGALVLAMLLRETAIGETMLKKENFEVLTVLAQVGVLFLLFQIGLQLDLKEISTLGKNIVYATILNTIGAFILGFLGMLALGFPLLIAAVIGVTRMPTAEAVVVPILDEFKILKTRPGQIILGAGILDDFIEVFLVAWVSVMIGAKQSQSHSIETVMASAGILIIVGFIAYKWLLPFLAKLTKPTVKNFTLLAVAVLFLLGGYTEKANLGLVIGALTAGIVMRPVLNHYREAREGMYEFLSPLNYGFLGLIFFLWIGFSIDLKGVWEDPILTLVLFFAGALGKVGGMFVLVWLKKMDWKEAIVTGVGLNARLTTEIIVAQLLFEFKIIDIKLFTALVAASSLTTLLVPMLLTWFIRLWKDEFSPISEQGEVNAN